MEINFFSKYVGTFVTRDLLVVVNAIPKNAMAIPR